jgi:hypothetical protein
VSQPIAKVVGVAASEDLCFGFETTKGPRVDDAITVTLKVVSIRMLRLGITASAGLFHPHGVVGEHGESVAEAQDSAVSTWQLAFGQSENPVEFYKQQMD